MHQYEPFADDTVRDILALLDLRPGALHAAEALRRIYSQFIVHRGDMIDAEALAAIRVLCEGTDLGGVA